MEGEVVGQVGTEGHQQGYWLLQAQRRAQVPSYCLEKQNWGVGTLAHDCQQGLVLGETEAGHAVGVVQTQDVHSLQRIVTPEVDVWVACAFS